LIYFGRELCPAQRHDPSACPICTWAAVPPYDQPGASPLKAAKKAAATSKASTAKAVAAVAAAKAAPAAKRARRSATL
jgi:endonuclease-3